MVDDPSRGVGDQTLGDPRRARFLLDRALALLPERSTERAAALVELAAAGWNLLKREELSCLLSEGADLAAELGLPVRGFASSGLPGPKGNRETFVWCGGEGAAIEP